jgi:hypothetical protein
MLYHLSHSASPFCIDYFWDRASLYARTVLHHNPPICASLHSWDDRHAPLHSTSGWDEVSPTFCLGWPWTNIFLISVSWVARIMGLSHCAWPKYVKKIFFCCTGVWTQGLHLELLYQHIFVKCFSNIGSLKLFARAGWLRTVILLISASWVARFQVWATSVQINMENFYFFT